MTGLTGFRTESARNPRASIAVPLLHVTSRKFALLHASYLTDANPRATANAATHHQAACNGYAEDGRWLR